MHVAVLALTAVWVLRTFQKEAQFHAEAAARAGELSVAAGRSLARSRVMRVRRARGHLRRRRHARRSPSRARPCSRSRRPTARRSRRAAAWASAAPTRSRSRRGWRTSPRSPTTSARRSTASGTPRTRAWRAAAASRGRSRSRSRPTRRARPTPSQILRMTYDRSIERVVVLGNGIAGVTAADHVRRRHPRVPHRPRRRRAAPALQPHGHQPADLRPLGDGGSLPQPGRVVRRARDRDVAQHARGADRPRGRARSSSAPGSSCPTTG